MNLEHTDMTEKIQRSEQFDSWTIIINTDENLN